MSVRIRPFTMSQLVAATKDGRLVVTIEVDVYEMLENSLEEFHELCHARLLGPDIDGKMTDIGYAVCGHTPNGVLVTVAADVTANPMAHTGIISL